ncbi:unnamed protein product, partial [Rotaria magnacalcarata]
MRPLRKRTYTPTPQVRSFISRSPNVEFLGVLVICIKINDVFTMMSDTRTNVKSGSGTGDHVATTEISEVL